MATPDGYTAVETMKNITLGNQAVTVVFEQKAHTSLIIELVDDTTGAPLPGSRFRVESEDGAYTTTVVTGEDGTATVGNLAAGRYMVAQETAPDGYVQDSGSPTRLFLAWSSGLWTATPRLLWLALPSRFLR